MPTAKSGFVRDRRAFTGTSGCPHLAAVTTQTIYGHLTRQVHLQSVSYLTLTTCFSSFDVFAAIRAFHCVSGGRHCGGKLSLLTLHLLSPEFSEMFFFSEKNLVAIYYCTEIKLQETRTQIVCVCVWLWLWLWFFSMQNSNTWLNVYSCSGI